MRIKLDENIPTSLIAPLTDLGHAVDTVTAEQLTGEPDGVVWDRAQEEERFFITQDLDFADARRFSPGTHHGLLLVRFRVPGRTALRRTIREAFMTEDVEEWIGKCVVMTETKTRVLADWPMEDS